MEGKVLGDLVTSGKQKVAGRGRILKHPFLMSFQGLKTRDFTRQHQFRSLFRTSGMALIQSINHHGWAPTPTFCLPDLMHVTRSPKSCPPYHKRSKPVTGDNASAEGYQNALYAMICHSNFKPYLTQHMP